MRRVRLAFLFFCVWLSFGTLGCEVKDLFDGSGSSLDRAESTSDPTPDDVVERALAPKPVRTSEIEGAGVSCYNSFDHFKKVVNRSKKRPPAGNEWHHIVNQNDTNKARFGRRLHCTDNLISLPASVHHQVSAVYTSKPEWAKPDFVRDVIARQSWSEQYHYGLQVLRSHGVEP